MAKDEEEKHAFRLWLEDAGRIMVIMGPILLVVGIVLNSYAHEFVTTVVNDMQLTPKSDMVIMTRKVEKLEENQDKLKDGQASITNRLEHIGTQVDNVEGLARESRDAQTKILLKLNEPLIRSRR